MQFKNALNFASFESKTWILRSDTSAMPMTMPVHFSNRVAICMGASQYSEVCLSILNLSLILKKSLKISYAILL